MERVDESEIILNRHIFIYSIVQEIKEKVPALQAAGNFTIDYLLYILSVSITEC